MPVTVLENEAFLKTLLVPRQIKKQLRLIDSVQTKCLVELIINAPCLGANKAGLKIRKASDKLNKYFSKKRKLDSKLLKKYLIKLHKEVKLIVRFMLQRVLCEVFVNICARE